ncbi:MAG: metallophosphoesterase [Proteobacteria bacterium]|nr:metallophosphoesterase [Pseudomonadota bacterium]
MKTKAWAGAVAALFALLALAPAALAASDRERTQWDHVARVVAIGDLHGDFDKFHDQLRQAGLIDAKDNWSGGATHLVQLGDVPDRAPDTRKILDLLIKLEPQARRAGGFVHALIGNHEAMNMEGDLRYTTPGEFAAFADRNSPRRRDAYYTAVVAALKAHPPTTGLPVIDAAYRARFDAEHPLGWVEHQLAWSPSGAYGRWILGHSAIIRIDDTLYLHAGVSAEFTPFDIDVEDKAVIAALRHQPEAAAGPHDILWNENGPLWYRGMALNDEAAEAASVAAVLARHQVRHVVVGHTKRYSMVNTRFGGAVILTDIAVPGGCPDPHAFLVKQGDAFTTVYRGKTLSLPMDDAGRRAYLAQVAALDAAAIPDPVKAARCSVDLGAKAPS